MNVTVMSDLLRDINQLEKEVVTIALADHEKYEYFSNRILDLKQELFDLDEENGALDAQEIIKKVQDLRFEFNQYLQTGEQNKDKIELVFSQNKEKISGKENRKRYRINLYKSILEDLKKTSNVDLERLETLRTKWKEEKEGKWGYSPVEIDVVEEEFAEVFFNYQIKSLQKNSTMLKENFREFCEQGKYEKKIKEKLLQKYEEKIEENEKTQPKDNWSEIEKDLLDDNINYLKEKNEEPLELPKLKTDTKKNKKK